MFTRCNAVNSFLKNIYYMFCIQTHVLSDVGLHCIVEDYILIVDFFHNTAHSWRKKQNQQVESCVGLCSVMDHPIPALTAPFSPGVLYILHTYRCTVQVSARVCRAHSQVFFLMCSHSNMTPGADQSCCLRGSGWGQLLRCLLPFLRGCFT